ncbi:MAG: hypothetical protein GX640_19285 [Fibrobacter sp.]|nr:hypothetical protein [Fibrobacter sp.]
MAMSFKKVMICLIFGIISYNFAGLNSNFYLDANDELINIPQSVALSGADMAIGSGISPESSPANLAFDTIHRLSVSYANYFQNTYSTSVIGFNAPLGSGIGLGVTAAYVFIPDIDLSPDSTEPVVTGSTNCSYIYFRIGASKRFTIQKNIEFSAGAALSAKRTKLVVYRGYNIGLDGGVRVSFLKSGFSSGLLFENITSITQWSKDENQIAFPHIRLGLGYEKDVRYLYGRLRLAYTSPDLLSNSGVNAELAVENKEQRLIKAPYLLITAAKYGAEYTIMRRVSLRIGLTQGRFSFGGGLQLFNERAGVDFAYMTHALSGTYQLSATYQW